MPPAASAWAQSTARLGVVDAEAHLGGKGNVRRHHGAHGADDLVEQLRLAEQGGTAAMAIDRRRRAAEIEVDPGRIQAHRRRAFSAMKGVGTEQLHAHRRAGRRPAAIEQFRADALEGLGWQDIGRDRINSQIPQS
jgi:hypothetical protein